MRKSDFLAPVLPFAAAVLLLEWLVGAGHVAAYLVPAPSSVWACLVQDRAELLEATLSTALSGLLGFTLSFTLGAVFASLLAVSTGFRKLFYPYAIFFQTVPIIAIAPLLVIWFGYGRAAVVASSFIVSVFPVVTSALTGLLATDRGLIDLFRLHRASRAQLFWKLKVPASLPFLLSGLNIAGGLAIIGAIVGEFISGNGLGSVIDVSRTQYRVDKVFAAVLLAALLGLGAFALLRYITARLLRNWHPSES